MGPLRPDSWRFRPNVTLTFGLRYEIGPIQARTTPMRAHPSIPIWRVGRGIFSSGRWPAASHSHSLRSGDQKLRSRWDGSAMSLAEEAHSSDLARLMSEPDTCIDLSSHSDERLALIAVKRPAARQKLCEHRSES